MRTKINKELINHTISNNLANNYNSLGLMSNPDKIINRFGNGYEILRDLRNDPHLWSCIQSRKSGSMQLEHKLSTDNSQKLPNTKYSYFEKMIKLIDLESLYSDILDAIMFGYQPIEIVWSRDRKDRLYYPTIFDALPQEYFEINNTGKINLKRNYSNKLQQNKSISELKLLNIRHEFNYSNPYGTALLSKCYWSVKFKNGGIKLWVSFMEKYGMPLVLGKIRRGASFEESEKLANELSDMCEDAVIVTPDDVEIQLHDASRSSSTELFNEMIKFCNSEISKVILSQTLTSDVSTGSYAASKTHNEIRKDVIKKDVKLIEKTMNRIIRMFYEVNKKAFMDLNTLPEFSLVINE